MLFDKYTKIIDQIAGQEIQELWLHNFGESTLHPDFIRMIRYAFDKGIFPIIFSTNSTALSGEYGRELLQSGLDCIILSLDGAAPLTFEKLRCGSDYREISDNIKNILGLKKNLGINSPALILQCIYSDETKDEIREYIREWAPHLNKTDRISIKEYNDFAGRLEMKLPATDDFSRMPCNVILENMVIFWNGDVTPCCLDMEGEMNAGNVFESSVRKVWEGKKYRRLREAVQDEKYKELEFCRNCTQGIGREKSFFLPDMTEIIF